MNEDYKRGQTAAIGGLVLHLALSALLMVVWLFSRSVGAYAIFWLVLGGSILWIISAVLFYCRTMALLEQREIEELSRTGKGDALFGEEVAEMRLAQRRLELIEKWFSPAVTLVLAIYLALLGVSALRPLLAGATPPTVTGNPLTWAFCCLGAAFLSFLFSRYAIGMSKMPEWRLLRAPGSYLSISALAGGLLCVAFFCLHLGIPWPMQLLPWIIGAGMLILAAELLMNFVLDFYRPRAPGVEHRPSFDSRLANLLSEPGGIAHSIAEALNYQFGFEVSGTWFYQLLQKTFVPLILFGAVAMLAMSCVTIVAPGRSGVVLTWGRAPEDRSVLAPGIHFKWPWPVQTVDMADTDAIRSITVGVGAARSAAEAQADIIEGVEVYIWKREHGKAFEQNFLVPREETMPVREADVTMLVEDAPAAEGEASARAYGALGIMRFVMTMQYTVSDLYRFGYAVRNPEQILKDIATREMTRFAARHDVDTLLSAEREQIAEQLRQSITAAAEAHDLGVEIVAVMLNGLHPPTDVAEAFEEVIKADREQVGKILVARSQREANLSRVAGSSELAERIARAGNLEEAADPLEQAGGAAQTIINEARVERWKVVNAERGRWELFSKQLEAFHKAPRLYMLNRKLDVLAEALSGARKYVLGVDPSNVEIRYDDNRRTMGGGITMGQ